MTKEYHWPVSKFIETKLVDEPNPGFKDVPDGRVAVVSAFTEQARIGYAIWRFRIGAEQAIPNRKPRRAAKLHPSEMLCACSLE